MSIPRVAGYLRRRFRPRKDRTPESGVPWQELAAALGALEEELETVNSLLQSMPAIESPAAGKPTKFVV